MWHGQSDLDPARIIAKADRARTAGVIMQGAPQLQLSDCGLHSCGHIRIPCKVQWPYQVKTVSSELSF